MDGNDKNKSNNIWQRRGESYFPNSIADSTKIIPPAIYRYCTSPQMGWWLEKTTDRYTFPYKIYGTHDAIISRVSRAWRELNTSFGVLLNGLKGTGKTIAAQKIVNWAIDEGMIVLNVSSPVPLAEILEKVERPMLVLFDEFEKTHNEEESRGCQQQLLSAIDGLSRNEFKRLFLFTTNQKDVNDNLMNRPSRIRYVWEFDRLSDDVIEMLLNDILDPKLSHLRMDIITYLNTRQVLTMDVAKTVINECNVFKEAPNAFKEFMNLSEKEPGAFKIEIIDSLGGNTEVTPYFKSSNGAFLQSIMSKNGRQSFLDDYTSRGRKAIVQSTMGQYIEILGPTDVDNEWICHIQMPIYKTWITPKMEQGCSRYLWLDEQPAGWRVPEWARKLESGSALTDDDENAIDKWVNNCSVFGTPNRKKVKIRFTIDNKPYRYDHKSAFDGF